MGLHKSRRLRFAVEYFSISFGGRIPGHDPDIYKYRATMILES